MPEPRSRRLALRLAAVLALVPLAAAAADPAPERGGELDRWVERELTPWLSARVAEHPRLRGEPLTVVVVNGERPDPVPNALAAGLAERLRRALLNTPGAVLAREAATPDWQQPTPPRLDCRPSSARYRIAVAADRAGDGGRVEVRVLDLDDQAWVSGFALDWEGRLTRGERAAAGREAPVERLRGERGLPFDSREPDRLAARLAYSLGCGLLARPDEAPAVWLGEGAAAADYAPVLRLVANYLAKADLLRIAPDPAAADLALSAEVHAVDGRLAQLWVALRPPAGTATGIEAAAYVRSAGGAAAPGPNPPPAVAVVDPGRPPVLASLRVLRLPRPCRPGDCAARGEPLDPAAPLPAGAPLALESVSRGPAAVYLLELEHGAGLRRLAPSDCRPDAGVPIEPGRRLRHALDEAAGERSYFAVALAPEADGGRLPRLLADVPSGCGAAPLAGAALSRWLASLDAATRENGLEWQALRLAFAATGTGTLRADRR